MKINRYGFALLFLLSVSVSAAGAMKLKAGDMWRYHIRYEWVTIGHLSIAVKAIERDGRKKMATLELRAKSTVSFYKARFHYTAKVEVTSFRPYYFANRRWIGNKSRIIHYHWDYSAKKIHYRSTYYEHGKVMKRKNGDIPLKPKMYDGFSTVWFAMRETMKPPHLTSSYFISSYDYGMILYNFRKQKKSLRIPTVKTPLTGIYMSGRLTKEGGVAGLKGKFSGWFSNSNYRVPLRAHMRVFIGRVILEMTPKSAKTLLERIRSAEENTEKTARKG